MGELVALRNTVELRGVAVDLDSEVGVGFTTDCARYTEGLIAEEVMKEKYGLSDTAWMELGKNKPLVLALDRIRTRRIRNGDATREMAQEVFLQAPSVLGDILTDGNAPARNRVDAIRELRAIAANTPENAPTADTARFVIRIDLTAGGGEAVQFNKPLAVGAKCDDEKPLVIESPLVIEPSKDGDRSFERSTKPRKDESSGKSL